MTKAEEERERRINRLARKIADESAVSLIECNSRPVAEDYWEIDPKAISAGCIVEAQVYLELRGMLERHPKNPLWVRAK